MHIEATFYAVHCTQYDMIAGGGSGGAGASGYTDEVRHYVYAHKNTPDNKFIFFRFINTK